MAGVDPRAELLFIPGGGLFWGVDSSFLAYAAYLALGERMLAVTVVSLLEPPETAGRAAEFAGVYGFKHAALELNPLQNPLFRSNPVDRCYHCKSSILNALWELARQQGYQAVAEGQNADDLSDYRPGGKAVSETGTVSPLLNQGLNKAEIRTLAKAFDLSTWNRPSTPCLATRIPYGTEITEKTLTQIGRAEAYLHEQGFEVARVRCHQDLARIELQPEQIQRLFAIRSDLVEVFHQLGFHFITLDLQGYRMGSLNEGLNG